MSRPVISLASPPKAETPQIAEASRTFLFKLKPPDSDISLQENQADDDRELEVFDAEKYFKEGLNGSPGLGKRSLSFRHYNRDNHHEEAFANKQPPSMAAMSISGSSRNSRSSLLHHGSTRLKPGKSKKILAAICCNCSCTGKSSVEIDDSVAECNRRSDTGTVLHQTEKSRDYRGMEFEEPGLRVNSYGLFSFPIFSLNQEDAGPPLKVWSAVAGNGKNALILEKKSETEEQVKCARIFSKTHNESDSDSSSDLFEIKSLSKDKPLKFPGSINCYAPSEASIEWSVITASAADFSAMSDSEEFTSASTSTIRRPSKPGMNSRTVSETSKLRPNILSGCNTQKAVGVVGDAHKVNEQTVFKQQVREQSFTQRRSHEESKHSFSVARSRRESFEARVRPQTR